MKLYIFLTSLIFCCTCEASLKKYCGKFALIGLRSFHKEVNTTWSKIEKLYHKDRKNLSHVKELYALSNVETKRIIRNEIALFLEIQCTKYNPTPLTRSAITKIVKFNKFYEQIAQDDIKVG